MKRMLTFCSLPSNSSSKKVKTGIAPSEYVIRNILNYSKALAVLKTEEIGQVNRVMN
jgi:hypothetical protein